ncbi:MAG TPA: hypothetical protein PKE57_00210 [Cellvibrionaceae bacterium]|nr:hypothetical protein [Cellvibrionaceae bacterium]HMW46911.1 hypothetical protein [Cellvibrionaceae bacterium]HMW70819.1 hypothetical protein [Cellvibrionaceae bacterium]HMY37832.1 hypothetical protein [Marinagarivorans sp.]HNG59460.1 hypothetical protein [Cellvibrionaceae bacterium]
MAQPDLISLNIPAADLQDIQAAITTLTTKLGPHLITLSSADRKEIPKMGDKTQAFVGKAREYASQNRDLVPGYLDLAAFEIDWKAVEVLTSLQRQLAPLADNLSDSLALSGSEAYQAALIFYRNVKMAARAGVPNAKTVEADLSSRFPGGSAKASAAAVANPA